MIPIPCLFITLASLAVGSIVSAAEPELPSESKRLLKLLDEYEARQQKRVDELVASKQKEVIAILEKHLKQKMKNGQLDSALAIRKEIEHLQKLTVGDIPDSLELTGEKFIPSGKVKPWDKVSTYYVIDRDKDGGKLLLEFAHKDLAKMLNAYKMVSLHLTAANLEFADSVDTLVVRNKNKILARKIGVKKSEKIKILLETWKLSVVDGKLSIMIENTGSDGISLVGMSQKGAAKLVFEK